MSTRSIWLVIADDKVKLQGWVEPSLTEAQYALKDMSNFKDITTSLFRLSLIKGKLFVEKKNGSSK